MPPPMLPTASLQPDCIVPPTKLATRVVALAHSVSPQVRDSLLTVCVSRLIFPLRNWHCNREAREDWMPVGRKGRAEGRNPAARQQLVGLAHSPRDQPKPALFVADKALVLRPDSPLVDPHGGYPQPGVEVPASFLHSLRSLPILGSLGSAWVPPLF